MKFLQTVQVLIDRWQTARLRRKILDKKLEDLTDPTFLDRVSGSRHA